jgi:hypothetical protein
MINSIIDESVTSQKEFDKKRKIEEVTINNKQNENELSNKKTDLNNIKVINDNGDLSKDLVLVIDCFRKSIELGWQKYIELNDWVLRNEITRFMLKTSDLRQKFLDRFKQYMNPFIRDDFYDVVDNKIKYYSELYETTGEINVPLLKKDCLSDIATWGISLENIGKSRYSTHRTVYPPGEAMRFSDTDPRKNLISETNLTAIAKLHMKGNESIQYITHNIKSLITNF